MIGNVEVYTKPDCPYCSRAKQLLRNQGVLIQNTNSTSILLAKLF